VVVAAIGAVAIAALGAAGFIAHQLKRESVRRAVAETETDTDTGWAPGTEILTAAEASGQLAIDPTKPPYRPRVRLGPGRIEWALLRVCVSETGVVKSVSFIKTPTQPDLDSAIRDAVLRWRYRPHLRDHEPVPFCAPVRLSLNGRWRDSGPASPAAGAVGNPANP
jgi:hypothetical protein